MLQEQQRKELIDLIAKGDLEGLRKFMKILKGDRVELSTFYEGLKYTSSEDRKDDVQVEIKGELKSFFEQLNQLNDGNAFTPSDSAPNW